MDSQLTLTDLSDPALPAENVIIAFDGDDMQNTTLRIHGTHSPSYIVHTIGNITAVYAGDCLLATVTRRMFLWDQITFPGFRPMCLGHWLKAPMLVPFPLVFHVRGRRFEWRSNILKQLVLCESTRPDDIVAWFSKSKSRWDNSDHMTRPAHLTIKPQVAELRDLIVLSCILAERKLVQLISAEQRKATSYIVTAVIF